MSRSALNCENWLRKVRKQVAFYVRFGRKQPFRLNDHHGREAVVDRCATMVSDGSRAVIRQGRWYQVRRGNPERAHGSHQKAPERPHGVGDRVFHRGATAALWRLPEGSWGVCGI